MALHDAMIEAGTDELVARSSADHTTDDLALEELLVEEISIDGMCGVY